MDYKSMGARIRKCRKQMKISQEALSEQVGISASFLGHIERGTRVASMETLIALCNTLKVSPQYLLADSLDLDVFGDPYDPNEKDPIMKEKLLHLLNLAIQVVDSNL